MVPLTRSSISLQWKNPTCLRRLMSSTVMVCEIGEKITAYDKETNYTVFFDTDGETTTFQLPDPDVRVVSLSDSHSDDDDFQ